VFLDRASGRLASTMDERYLALAVPFFVVSMVGEAWLSKRTGKRYYRLHDTVGSLGCGIGQTLLGFWMNVVVVAAYAWVANAAPWRLPARPGSCGLAASSASTSAIIGSIARVIA